MTDYYLGTTTTFRTREEADSAAARLSFAVVRYVGYWFQVHELVLTPDWVPEGTVWPNPFELTKEEHAALEEVRAITGAEVVVGVDPASPDGDRDAVVVGKHTGDQFVLTDAAVLNPGQYVLDINEEGKLKLSNANLGVVTPGHKKLNEVEASMIADVKYRGEAFIEIIESVRRQTRIPDCTDPSIVHFRDDAHAHKLQNALDRAEEAIMWAVKYITAGE